MEMSTPSWLDRKFLTTVLEEDSNSGPVNILSFTVRPACAPGDNYTSYMFRVRVEYETGVPTNQQAVSLMVKVPVEEGFIKEFSAQQDFFGREPELYNKVLPALERIVLCEFGPKSLNCPIKNMLIMKDLKEEGFFICEKTKQLEYSHCKTVFKKIAKFHAASVVSVRHNKEVFGDVGKDYIYVEDSFMEPLVRLGLKNMFENVSKDKRCAVLADYLVNKVDQVWSSCMKLTKPKSNRGFNVLNHGDLWINNLMFKYSTSGEVLDVKFIDYQYTRLASPVNDLIFFIWTSANEEVREKRQKDLFHIYLNTLNKTLADLGCEERLSVEELRADLLGAVDWAILVVSYFVAIQMASPEDVPDFENLRKENCDSESFNKFFKGKNFNKLLPKLMQHLSEFFLAGNGILE